MYTISDSISLSDDDRTALRLIAKKYGFDNFNFFMFKEASAKSTQYEVYTEVVNEKHFQLLRDVFYALAGEMVGGIGSDDGRMDA